MTRRRILTEGSRGKERKAQQLAIVLLVITALIAMLTTLYSGKGSILGLYDPSTQYSVGELAEEDFYASRGFEYIDWPGAEDLAEARQRAILPLFNHQLRPTLQSKALVSRFIDIYHRDGAEGASRLLQEEGIDDSLYIVRQLLLRDIKERELIFDILQETADYLLERGLFSHAVLTEIKEEGYEIIEYRNASVRESLIDTLATKETLHTDLTEWYTGYAPLLDASGMQTVTDALVTLLEENVTYDRIGTAALRTEARSSVVPPTLIVERGTKIITKDTVVTRSQLEMLSFMQEHSVSYTILELVGRSIFILIISIVSVAVFLQVLGSDTRTYLYLNLMLSSVILSLVAMHVITWYFQDSSTLMLDSALPLFFAPLFTTHVASRKRLGFITAFMLSSFASLMYQATLMTFFFTFSVNAINIHFFRYSIKRLQDLFNWVFAILASSLAALAFSPLAAVPIHSMIPMITYLVANITLSLILTKAFVPLCEYLFNIPTAYRLNELAFADSPVIDRLSAVAQGTYNHSRYVSELAYQAAKTVGVNAMLARVGGLYHDIGKAEHPEYFVENQGSENKHDDIKPSLSVAIIKSHVKLGVEKGREAGLPQEVLDIIAQHHGNDIIQYFYSEATKQAQSDGLGVQEEDYSYTGQPPTFAESAIVMLADVVEAATRTIKQPSYSKYQKLVHSMVMGKIERGQLKDSGLSLTDLSQIEESFVQTLIGRDHHRIEYPEEG